MNNDRKSHIQIIVETAEDIMYYGHHWNIYDILRETKKKAKIGLKRGFHKKLFEEALPIIVMMYYFRIISKTPTIKNQPELLLHFIPGNAQEFPALATITSVQNALEEYNVAFVQPKVFIKVRPKQKSIPNAQRPQKLTKDDKQQLERIRDGFRKTLDQYNMNYTPTKVGSFWEHLTYQGNATESQGRGGAIDQGWLPTCCITST